MRFFFLFFLFSNSAFAADTFDVAWQNCKTYVGSSTNLTCRNESGLARVEAYSYSTGRWVQYWPYTASSYACPSGLPRDINEQCPPCPAGTYSNGTSCPQIPDCNAGTIGGGGYFDVNTKACVPPDPSHLGCELIYADSSESVAIGKYISEHQQYCPPANGCISNSSICTNDPATQSGYAAQQEADKNMAYWHAQQSANRADAAKTFASNSAETAAANKQAAIDTRNAAKADYEAKKAAAADPTSGVTKADVDAAFRKFGQAVDAVADFEAAANNSQAASSTASGHAAAANAAATAAGQSSPTTNAAAGKWGDAAAAADAAETAADEAGAEASMSRRDNGTGQVTGTAGATNDTTGLASESTLSSVKNAISQGFTDLKGAVDGLCQKMSICSDNQQVPDTPEPTAVGERDVGSLDISPKMTGDGSCPADQAINISGHVIAVSFSMICQFAAMINPIVILLAYIIGLRVLVSNSSLGG